MKVFLTATIFTPEDTLSFDYFQKCRSSLDAVTDSDMFMGLPNVKDGMIQDIEQLFRPGGKARFPGQEFNIGSRSRQITAAFRLAMSRLSPVTND